MQTVMVLMTVDGQSEIRLWGVVCVCARRGSCRSQNIGTLERPDPQLFGVAPESLHMHVGRPWHHVFA